MEDLYKKYGQQLYVEGEIWKDIKDYEGLYQASNLGRIKSLIKWKDGKTERILVQLPDTRGYYTVNLYKNKQIKRCFVARLIAKTFIYCNDNLLTVNHINSIKTHNYISNLEWITRSENSKLAHINRNYEHNFGSKNGNSKLQENQVRDIRSLYATGKFSYTCLGKLFNIHFSVIGRIIKGITWKHIL